MEEPDFLHATPDCLLPPEAWVNKKERFRCHVCAQKFSNIYRRRHHCRMCGELFCRQCIVNKFLHIAGRDKVTVKVCTPCAYEDADQAKRRRPRSPMPFRSSRRLEHMTKHSDDDMDDDAATKDLLDSPVLTESSSSRFSHAGGATSSSSRRSASAPIVHDLDFEEAQYSGPLDCPSAPCLFNEIERLAALKALGILYSPPEEIYNVICELAATTLHCPMAVVSFMDLERQWFKAKVGLAKNYFTRRISFCAHALATPEPTVVLDTRLDPRYCGNPLVTDYGVRFYAAAPLVTADGWPVGTLAVFDFQPHATCDVSSLVPLARGIMKQLDERRANIQGMRRRRQAASFDDRCHAASLAPKKSQLTPTIGPQKTPAALVAPMPLDPTVPAGDTGSSPLTSMRSSTSSSAVTTLSAASSTGAPKMESILFDLLNKTSETQQQLANQQGTMFATLGHHSEQIGKISEALARLESKLGSPVA